MKTTSIKAKRMWTTDQQWIGDTEGGNMTCWPTHLPLTYPVAIIEVDTPIALIRQVAKLIREGIDCGDNEIELSQWTAERMLRSLNILPPKRKTRKS